MGRFRQRGQILNEDEEEDENVLRQRGEERTEEGRTKRAREQRAVASERASGERPTSSERYQRASRTSAPLPRHGMDWMVMLVGLGPPAMDAYNLTLGFLKEKSVLSFVSYSLGSTSWPSDYRK